MNLLIQFEQKGNTNQKHKEIFHSPNFTAHSLSFLPKLRFNFNHNVQSRTGSSVTIGHKVDAAISGAFDIGQQRIINDVWQGMELNTIKNSFFLDVVISAVLLPVSLIPTIVHYQILYEILCFKIMT